MSLGLYHVVAPTKERLDRVGVLAPRYVSSMKRAKRAGLVFKICCSSIFLLSYSYVIL